MKLSVVIVNYNVRYFLELCLESVKAALETIDSEIIVVDNNSDDGSCEMVKNLFPEVVLVENKENVGFSRANNQAVKIAKGAHVCILNPDTVVAEDTFSKLLSFANTKNNLGIVGCKLIDGTGKFLPESKRNLPVVKVALQKMKGNTTHYYANHISENEVSKVQILVGAFMFMKRSTFIDLHGFDESYFMYGEDIDLSYKATKKGLDNYYFGETTIIHFKGESTLKDVNYAKRFYGAMQIFYKKHFRSNFIFDAFVWAGIKLVFLLRKEPQQTEKKITKWVVLSKDNLKKLSKNFEGEVQYASGIEKIENQCVVVFDSSKESFRSIIESMQELQNREEVYFRILNASSSFLIGSDSSSHRGEVVKI